MVTVNQDGRFSDTFLNDFAAPAPLKYRFVDSRAGPQLRETIWRPSSSSQQALALALYAACCSSALLLLVVLLQPDNVVPRRVQASRFPLGSKNPMWR